MFNFKNMSILKFLLFPFSILYRAITSIRNFLYDRGIFESKAFDVKVVCVGNLSVGGTGKSPMIEYLIENLKEDYNIVVLSRGYKRKTNGFHEVETTNEAHEVGDEPLQFKRKFSDIRVFVDANRRRGISNILKKYSETDMVLLDDAYQHRKVKADYNILLTTYDNPYFKDYLLPVGRLRESRYSAKRANTVIVTKCPQNLSDQVKFEFEKSLRLQPDQNLGFSKIRYSDKVLSKAKAQLLSRFDNFYLITGIANPKPLLEFLNYNEKSFEHLPFPDHYNFTKKDIEKFMALNKPILTTEKDYVRLKGCGISELFYLSISIEVDFDITKSVTEIL